MHSVFPIVNSQKQFAQKTYEVKDTEHGLAADRLHVQVPFGGFKKSENGREWGIIAFKDYLEYKLNYSRVFFEQ